MTTTHNNPLLDFRKPNSRFVPIHAAAGAGRRTRKNEVTSRNVNTSPCAQTTSADSLRRNRERTYVAKNVISRQKSSRHKSFRCPSHPAEERETRFPCQADAIC
jgi:hypothetical protein